MDGLVDKVYATAIFDIAVEKDKLDEYKSEIDAISDLFKDDANFLEFFRSPRVKKEEKKEVISNIFKGRVSDDILNLLFVLVDKKRERWINGIAREYSAMYDQKMNLADAHVKSVIALDDSMKEKLRKTLSDMTGKTIRLTCEVDKSILGGLWVKVDDKVIDSTIKEELKRLKKSLDKTIV